MNTQSVAPTPSGPGGTDRGIPRLIYLGRILWLCFFPLLTVVVGDLVLTCVQQAREALVAFGDSPAQRVAFTIAFVLWMVSAWYVARLLLGKRFEPDLIGECRSPGFARGLAEHLPRVLALVAGLPIPVVLWIKQPALRGLAVTLFACGAVILAGLVFRRSLARRGHQRWVENWQARGREAFEHFDGLSASAWVCIAALFVISLAVCFALPVAMAHLARPLGAPTLLLIALMSWTVFGGFALTYLPRSYGLPAMTWVPLLLLLAFYRFNENHPVAPHSAVQNALARDDIGHLFESWQAHRADPNAPVIFVASAGGASRAAYWTTSALGMLEDDARRARGAASGAGGFADHIFVISSVSGGSLGAAAFVATLDLTGEVGDGASACSSVRNTADSFTGQDHLSTVLGFMLFPDLLQRFLPLPIDAWDRSRGLEEVWSADWDALLASCGPKIQATNPWRESLTSLSARATPAHPLPLLALNSTALAAGQQVLQASFTLPRPDVFDVLSGSLATNSLTLAQAVHNSARFPYVSPGGVVRLQSGPIWDRLGDGGYVEASGTLMLTQIIRSLMDRKLIRQDQIRVLVLDNTPTDGSSYLCGIALPGGTGRPERPQNMPQPGEPIWPPGPDALVPVLGAFSTRDGRAISAAVDLRTLAGGCSPQFAELRLPEPRAGEEQPSMNWMLDSASRQQIDQVLTDPGRGSGDPDPNALLAQNLAIVRAWFEKPAPP